jgi:hypothetical protein
VSENENYRAEYIGFFDGNTGSQTKATRGMSAVSEKRYSFFGNVLCTSKTSMKKGRV